MPKQPDDPISLQELRYLARQTEPIWGGPFDRGEAPPQAWIDAENAGIMRRVYSPRRGYVITPKGRQMLKLAVCPTCGADLSAKTPDTDTPG